MAKPKLEYSEDEINEILDLFKNKTKKEGKVLTEYKSKTISNFNEELVKDNVKRKNGEPFNHYKYNFWAGKHRGTGEYNYGKKVILQRNEELRLQAERDPEEVEMQDIINIVNRNIKNPNKMTSLLCHYVKKQKDKIATILGENIKLTDENKNLKSKIALLEDTYTNIFFNSQIPNNSLNDMLSISKSHDAFISEELENMFEDGLSRFKALANLDYSSVSTEGSTQHNTLQSVISINEKKREMQREKELEDEGF